MQCVFLVSCVYKVRSFFITTRMYRLQSTVQNTSVSSHAFKSIHPPEMRSNVFFVYHVYYTRCSLFSKPFICTIYKVQCSASPEKHSNMLVFVFFKPGLVFLTPKTCLTPQKNLTKKLFWHFF